MSSAELAVALVAAAPGGAVAQVPVRVLAQVPEHVWAQAVALLAGLELLTAVLLVWRAPDQSPRVPLAVQGLALAGLVGVDAVTADEPVLWLIAALVAVLKGMLLPALVVRRPQGTFFGVTLVPVGGRAPVGPAAAVDAPAGGGRATRRSRIPLLLAAAALVVVADLAARPLSAVVAGPSGPAVPVGIALVLIGFMLLATGARSRDQLVGFLVLDNGIATTAFLATGGVPLVVELGVSLDVLLVVLVLQVLGARIDHAFAAPGDGTQTDLDQLRELHD